MRLSRVVLIAFSLGGLVPQLLAQNPQQRNDAAEVERLKIQAEERARQEVEQRDWETKLFQIKFVDPGELRAALTMFRSSISYSGGSLRVLSVRAPKEIMPAIEDAIKRLDVPMSRKDAELTIHVLLASDQPSTTPLPANLQPVINQLKNVLSYKGFQLIDTLIARGRDSNETSLQGALPVEHAPFPGNVTYRFRARLRILNPDAKDPVLRLEGMGFLLTVPISTQGQTTDLQINTDVEIPRGQQVVVGKATYNDRAFILVMNAKFD
jgi:hypothetical protein